MNKNAHRAVTFSEALTFWLKLGFISFGGPAGQIAIMHRVLVDEKKWIEEQLRSLGAQGMQAALTLLWDARFSLITAVLAGLGRASAEVGAVMIVGGNIDGVTRVMTTAIALETSKGDLPLALGLGFVLIAIVLVLNAGAQLVKEAAQRRFG